MNDGQDVVKVADHNMIEVKLAEMKNQNDNADQSAVQDSVPMEDEYEEAKRFPGQGVPGQGSSIQVQNKQAQDE